MLTKGNLKRLVFKSRNLQHCEAFHFPSQFDSTNACEKLLVMSTAFIFKHLLDVLKIESNLDGEGGGEIDKEWLPQLVQSCAALRDAAKEKETSNKDRSVIFPKVLKCFSRLMNKAVSIPLSEIKYPKLVETLLEGMFNLLSTLYQADQETRVLLQKAMIDEQSSVLMIFLHLITIFETIGKKNSGALQNEIEDEHLTEISLQLYNAILVSVYMITNDTISTERFVNVESHKLNHVFSGALATQTIQSLLTFCHHKSKRISTEAATDLLYTLRCFKQHREVWRTCFPGAFSGLFVLTQSGYKRYGSMLLLCTYSFSGETIRWIPHRVSSVCNSLIIFELFIMTNHLLFDSFSLSQWIWSSQSRAERSAGADLHSHRG